MAWIYRVIVSKEVKWMWKEPVIAYSEVLLRHLRGGTFCNTPHSRQPVVGPRFEPGTSKTGTFYSHHSSATRYVFL